MARTGNETGDEETGVPSKQALPIDPMEQVRELLFGEAKRSAEQNFEALEAKIEAMRADFLARLAALESQITQLSRDTEENHSASLHAVGSAIAQLGATVQNLGSQRKGGGNG